MSNIDVNDPYGFEKMNADQLRRKIIELVAQNHTLEDDKKDFNTSTNDLIKENKKRIRMAVEKIGLVDLRDRAAEAEATSPQLASVTQFPQK